MTHGSGLVRAILASTVFVAAVLVVVVVSSGHEQIFELLLWLEGQGTAGVFLFALVMALVVLFLLPGAPFTTGAGFVFGVVLGTVAVVAGTTVGAVLSFLTARYLLSRPAARYMKNHPALGTVTQEVTKSGWRAVLSVRLIPFFPSKLANYIFGLTRVPLATFAAGTFVGIIPLSLHNVYLGAIAADIAAPGSLGQERSAVAWVIYILGFLATAAAVLYVGRLAKRVLAHESEKPA